MPYKTTLVDAQCLTNKSPVALAAIGLSIPSQTLTDIKFSAIRLRWNSTAGRTRLCRIQGCHNRDERHRTTDEPSIASERLRQRYQRRLGSVSGSPNPPELPTDDPNLGCPINAPHSPGSSATSMPFGEEPRAARTSEDASNARDLSRPTPHPPASGTVSENKHPG